MQRTIRHNTGRNYGAAQVLEITVPHISYDANDEAQDVVVGFSDSARGIAGTVVLPLLWKDCNDTDRDIARDVLAAYDHGRYDLV